MGMSASQARFLMLTGQKNDNEYQAQQISHERLMLSQQTEQATKEYNEKIDNRVLLFNVPNFNGGERAEIRLTYDNITKEGPDGMGYRLVSAAGHKILAPSVDALSDKDKELYAKSPELFWIDPDVANPDLLEKNLRDGNYVIQVPKKDSKEGSTTTEWEDTAIAGIPFINDTYNKMDDAQAENAYDMIKERIQNQDKKLELKLKQLDTQHKAIETEMQSVEKVIQKNVETTFKTFG